MAVLLVVGGVERLAVAGAAAVVDPDHDVAVVDEELDVGAVGAPRLSARSAVDPDEGRSLRVRRCLVRLVEDVRDGQPVERRKAHDLRVDEVRGIHVLGQRVRQAPRRLSAELEDIEIVGPAIFVQLEGEPGLAP